MEHTKGKAIDIITSPEIKTMESTPSQESDHIEQTEFNGKVMPNFKTMDSTPSVVTFDANSSANPKPLAAEEKSSMEFNGKVIDIITVSSAYSPNFKTMESTLRESYVVSLDAEWRPENFEEEKSNPSNSSAVPKPPAKPKSKFPYFPQVCLLQIFCLPNTSGRPVVFLLDLWQLQFHPPSIPKIHELLRGIFESSSIVKLGHQFRNDFIKISSTFQFHFKPKGWKTGFDRVDLYLDIFEIYNKILFKQQKTQITQPKNLSEICYDCFGTRLSKENQQKDWQERPLKKERMKYAALDAYCLVEILYAYWREVLGEGNTTIKDNLLQTVRDCKGKYSGNIVLIDSERLPKGYIMNNEGESIARPIPAQPISEGPRPWDRSLGGNGCPQFVCGTMVVGLAKLMRVAGIDTKIANKSNSRIKDLIEQAQKEKRVLLTRKAKPKEHDHLNYYKLKNLLKDDQLAEVFKAFDLERNKDFISRCTRCNEQFKTRPLSTEEAIEAATGFSILGWCGICEDLYDDLLFVHENLGGMKFDLYIE